MRRALPAVSIVLALAATSIGHAAPRTARAFFVGPRTVIPSASLGKVLCAGGDQRARPGGACFAIAPGETSAAIDLVDYTSDVPDAVYFFFDSALVALSAAGYRMCDKEVSIGIPASAAFLVVVPGAHAYKLGFDLCKSHGQREVLGVAGIITATFS